MKKHFTEEEKWMTYKHMKICTSLAIRKIQIINFEETPNNS